jgi:hypothetical protein
MDKYQTPKGYDETVTVLKSTKKREEGEVLGEWEAEGRCASTAVQLKKLAKQVRSG